MNSIKFEENNGDIVQKLGLTEERANEIQELVCTSMNKYGDVAEVMDIMQTICKNDNELAFSNYRIGKCSNCPAQMLKDLAEELSNESDEDVEKFFKESLGSELGTSTKLKKVLEDNAEGAERQIVNEELFIHIGRQAVLSELKNIINMLGEQEGRDFYMEVKNDIRPGHRVMIIGTHKAGETMMVYVLNTPDGLTFLLHTLNPRLALLFLKDNLPAVIGKPNSLLAISAIEAKLNEADKKIESAEPVFLGRDANAEIFNLIDMEAIDVVKQVETVKDRVIVALFSTEGGTKKWLLTTKIGDDLLVTSSTDFKGLKANLVASNLGERVKIGLLKAVDEAQSNN